MQHLGKSLSTVLGSLCAMAVLTGSARGAGADDACRQAATAIAQDALTLHDLWLKAFLRLTADGRAPGPACWRREPCF